MDRLKGFQIILQGGTADSPPRIFVRYEMTDLSERVKPLDDADLTKAVFSEGLEGEFWYDVVKEVELSEGIGVPPEE